MRVVSMCRLIAHSTEGFLQSICDQDPEKASILKAYQISKHADYYACARAGTLMRNLCVTILLI